MYAPADAPGLGSTATGAPPCTRVASGSTIPWLQDPYKPPTEDPKYVPHPDFLYAVLRTCPPSPSQWVQGAVFGPALRLGGSAEGDAVALQLPDGSWGWADFGQINCVQSGVPPEGRFSDGTFGRAATMIRLRGEWGFTYGSPARPRVIVQEWEQLDCSARVTDPWGNDAGLTGYTVALGAAGPCLGPHQYQPERQEYTGPQPVEGGRFTARGHVGIVSGILRFAAPRSADPLVLGADNGALDGPVAEELKQKIVDIASTAPDWYPSAKSSWDTTVTVRVYEKSAYTPGYELEDYTVHGYDGPARAGRSGRGVWCHDPDPLPWGTFFDCSDYPVREDGQDQPVPERPEDRDPSDPTAEPTEPGGEPPPSGTPDSPSGDLPPLGPGGNGAGPGPGSGGDTGGGNGAGPSPVAPTGLNTLALAGGAGLLLFLLTRERDRK